MTDPTPILTQLMRVIEDRKAVRPAHSYTSRLFDKGAERIGDKIVEEAKEMAASGQVLAESKIAKQGDKAAEDLRRDLAHEAADLLYHMLVMLAFCNVSLEEVDAELARRFGTSGLDEKAARGK